jgi:hypothetical protein
MQAELQQVLELQPFWTSTRSDEMDERGALVRHDIAAWLDDHSEMLAAAIGIPADDFLAEGRDATGLKTRVPWTRFGSRNRSPRATDGLYIVYLWAFDGSAVYLSLNQGTTKFEGGDFVRRPVATLESRVQWAHEVLTEWVNDREDLVSPSLEDVGDNSLGHGYELGNIAAIRYELDAIPGDGQLLDDAISFGTALGKLYEAAEAAPLPDEAPEVMAAEAAAEEAAGKRRKPTAGFRQNAVERDLIEKHAEKMAANFYAAKGWRVTRRGAPFDLELTRDSEKLTVEVKGTTSHGEAVVLTRNEVVHHTAAYPHNALVVVRNIILDRSTSPPTVSGGELFERQPWDIKDDGLKVISYRYSVPTDLYD